MAFCELRYISAALQKATAANIILPEGKEGPFYTLYLLHGLSDDHTMWARRTSIERYVQNLPLIVVMPDGGRGFYCDAEVGATYDSAIAKDLVGLVDAQFNTRAERGGRCLAGLSMGGYGAVRLALAHPDLFCSAVSHSGAMHFGHNRPDNEEFLRILGNSPENGPNDLYALAKNVSEEMRPALRIDCGEKDFLLEANRTFHIYLDEIGYPHEYAEFPGDHNWEYWDIHVQEAIAFHVRNLGIE